MIRGGNRNHPRTKKYAKARRKLKHFSWTVVDAVRFSMINIAISVAFRYNKIKGDALCR